MMMKILIARKKIVIQKLSRLTDHYVYAFSDYEASHSLVGQRMPDQEEDDLWRLIEDAEEVKDSLRGLACIDILTGTMAYQSKDMIENVVLFHKWPDIAKNPSEEADKKSPMTLPMTTPTKSPGTPPFSSPYSPRTRTSCSTTPPTFPPSARRCAAGQGLLTSGRTWPGVWRSSRPGTGSLRGRGLPSLPRTSSRGAGG